MSQSYSEPMYSAMYYGFFDGSLFTTNVNLEYVSKKFIGTVTGSGAADMEYYRTSDSPPEPIVNGRFTNILVRTKNATDYIQDTYQHYIYRDLNDNGMCDAGEPVLNYYETINFGSWLTNSVYYVTFVADRYLEHGIIHGSAAADFDFENHYVFYPGPECAWTNYIFGGTLKTNSGQTIFKDFNGNQAADYSDDVLTWLGTGSDRVISNQTDITNDYWLKAIYMNASVGGTGGSGYWLTERNWCNQASSNVIQNNSGTLDLYCLSNDTYGESYYIVAFEDANANSMFDKDSDPFVYCLYGVDCYGPADGTNVTKNFYLTNYILNITLVGSFSGYTHPKIGIYQFTCDYYYTKTFPFETGTITNLIDTNSFVFQVFAFDDADNNNVFDSGETIISTNAGSSYGHVEVAVQYAVEYLTNIDLLVH